MEIALPMKAIRSIFGDRFLLKFYFSLTQLKGKNESMVNDFGNVGCMGSICPANYRQAWCTNQNGT